jgi:hypothetical protein
MEYAVGVLDASAGYLQQEQFKKRGLGNVAPGYASTVGAGENFGLGMGVGLSMNLHQHQPQPQQLQQHPTLQQQWHRQELTHSARGQLSPVTGYEDSEDEDEDDEDGEMTDGSTTSSRRPPGLHSNSQSPSMKQYQGFPFQNSPSSTLHQHDPLGTNASTPTSTTSSGFDFFMIPNSIPSRPLANGGREAGAVTRGELDFLAATAGWHGRREGDD